MNEVRRATLKDIAVSLGVSVNTVSRALTGKDSVGEETRARIRAEADRLGYVPNTLARSLVRGSAMTLGLVITNPSNPFYAKLISVIEQRGKVHGYSFMLLVTEENAEDDRTAAETLLQWGVDGALVVPVQGDPASREHAAWGRLHNSGLPLVLLNRDLPELGLDFVGVDYREGARQATSHLLAAGARKVCLLEEDLPITAVRDRIDGFQAALAEHGLAESVGSIVSVPTRRHEASALPWDPADSYRVAQEIFAAPETPDAVLVGNDYFALGVYRAAQETGLRVPEDVLVGGFGDHPFAAYLNPPLTTVGLPASDIGSAAIDLLLQRMKGQHDYDSAQNTGDPRKLRLLPELRTRESTARN
ncbi:LacI family transcriptional regulator [Tamaricihabitans halophyticus]|uniref:LacI family transcriptional regulator n=1 Tax=Tamaricihabitans halophyticus TaxID=1262583 RepID=A0A4R2QFX6_9PSEU|nr:LacI family DNA-binding transcriptional regulator [Tamaricihabitans halophyticus]TCP47228.1 LacI family transcriptional regulator [Tamaricihabitans halophyticus]